MGRERRRWTRQAAAVARAVATAVALGGRAAPAGAQAAAGPHVELARACAAARPDADDDGLSDACELALARAAAPLLVVDRRDCLWRDDVARLDGAYLFAVAPAAGGARVAYLPAFPRDCGWRGWRCTLRAGRCGAHAGDSEAMAVELRRGPAPGDWRVGGVFLSAHCFGRSGGRCRWYRGAALASFAFDGLAPRAWVARDKHALYPSRRACDTGHWGWDTCDGNDRAVRVPVLDASQNVGSRARPAPCMPAASLAVALADAAPHATECAWDAARAFRGWRGRHDGAPPTSYARLLHLLIETP